MGKEVATDTSKLPAAVQGMAQALAVSAGDAGQDIGGELYLRFSKGEWSYGAEEEEPEAGSLWAVNPFQCQHGWVAWGEQGSDNEGKVMGERMVPAANPMPRLEDLPEVDGQWSKAVGLQLRCVSGEDEGVQVVFKSNSRGGRQLYAAVLKAIVDRINGGHDDIVPLVTLEVDSYKHKKYGKIHTPEMPVQKWTTMDAMPAADDGEEDDDGEPEGEPEEPPRRRRAAAAAPEADDEQEEDEEEQPRRRRRRTRA